MSSACSKTWLYLLMTQIMINPKWFWREYSLVSWILSFLGLKHVIILKISSDFYCSCERCYLGGGFLTPWADWQTLLHSKTPSRLGQLISDFTSKTDQFPGNLFHENTQVTVQCPKYQYAGNYQMSATSRATHVGITLEVIWFVISVVSL